jgi:urea transporter
VACAWDFFAKRWSDFRASEWACSAGSFPRSVAIVFFSANPVTGLAILGAIGALAPQALLFLAGAFAVGFITARVLALPKALIDDGALLYNALLVGLGIGWLSRGLEFSFFEQAALLAGASAFAVILSAALWHVAVRVLGFPALSMAFVAVFGLLLWWFPLAAARAALTDSGLPDDPAWLPFWIRTFLRSCGTIFFMPSATAGALVLAAVLLWSRLAVVYAAVGYAAGVIVVSGLGSLGIVFDGIFPGHNYLLAGLALGAIYHVPSRSSMALAALAGGMAAVSTAAVQTVAQGSGWEFLPIPFILTIWCLLAALRLRPDPGSLRINFTPGLAPEQVWRRQLVADFLAPSPPESASRSPALYLPCAGTATITQGIGGTLSHRGLWRYALDFEQHDASGAAVPEESAHRIEAYYTFDMPIHSPVAGTVLQIVDDVADNAPGACNYAQNWGNHVILRSRDEHYVLLAHFKRGGVLVTPGRYVRAGEKLGYCGNSGRSPVPHLHLHVQAGPAPGSPTLPFRLANYLVERRAGVEWVASGVPSEGDRVSPAKPDESVIDVLGRLTPKRVPYMACFENAEGRRQRVFGEAISISVDDHGRFVLASECGGRIVAHVDEHGWSIVEADPRGSLFLRCLALAAPRLPLTRAFGLHWHNRVDPTSWRPSWRRVLGSFLGAFFGAPVLTTTSGYSSGADGALHLTTLVRTTSPHLPHRIEVDWKPFAGPVRLEAHFPHTTLYFTTP